MDEKETKKFDNMTGLELLTLLSKVMSTTPLERDLQEHIQEAIKRRKEEERNTHKINIKGTKR